MKLYFVRHGQTYLNKYKRMQGWADAPLTPEGEKVALETGERLADIQFAGVYTSDLGRTQQTARLILSTNNSQREIIPMAAFRESCFGFFEGAEDKEFYSKVAEKHGITFGEVFTKLDMETVSEDMLELDPFKDAELTPVVLQRVLTGLEEVIQQHKDEDTLMIVTHGNIIRTLVHHIAPEIPVMVNIKNSSITVVDVTSSGYQVEKFNT